jgi:hypothetical protein
MGRSIRISDAKGRSRGGNAPMKPFRSLSGTMSLTPFTGLLWQQPSRGSSGQPLPMQPAPQGIRSFN